MPNFIKHATTGGAVGAALLALFNVAKQYNQKAIDPDYKINWSEVGSKALFGAAIGSACGVIPDLLEPARTPNHRGFFHSVSAAGVILYGLKRMSAINTITDSEKEVVATAAICYLSHLALDSETPMGLPIVA